MLRTYTDNTAAHAREVYRNLLIGLEQREADSPIDVPTDEGEVNVLDVQQAKDDEISDITTSTALTKAAQKAVSDEAKLRHKPFVKDTHDRFLAIVDKPTSLIESLIRIARAF